MLSCLSGDSLFWLKMCGALEDTWGPTAHASFQLTSLSYLQSRGLLGSLGSPPGVSGLTHFLLVALVLCFSSTRWALKSHVYKSFLFSSFVLMGLYCPCPFIIPRKRSLEKERGGKWLEWMSWGCSGLYFSDFMSFLKTTLSHLQAFSFHSIGILNSL